MPPPSPVTITAATNRPPPPARNIRAPRTPEQITAVVEAVAPKPVNVLAVDPSWMTVKALADLGVRRISVGSAMARVAWKAFIGVARQIAEDGSFAGLADAEPFKTLDTLFSE